MDHVTLAYDLMCIVTSAAMAVLAADRTDIPYRWLIVYITGVASVSWRTYRLYNTWQGKALRFDHPLWWHDMVLSTSAVLLGWYTCRETRSAVTAVIVLMTFAWVAETMNLHRMSCVSHTMGHILLVVILAAYSRVVSRTFSPA